MRIALVNVGAALTAIGFRFVAASVRQHFDDLELFFIIPSSSRSLVDIMRDATPVHLTDIDFAAIARELANFDVVGFSGMTENVPDIVPIIREIRKLRTDSFVVWGGIHAILFPEDAVQFADAVCVGEGELAFPTLLQRLAKGDDYHGTPNFWFKDTSNVQIKSPNISLPGSNELDQLPFPEFSYTHERIYRKNKKKFTGVTLLDFLHSEALSYTAIWTRGCPFACSYCCNSRLNKINDSRKIRYGSVDRLIAEIHHIRGIFPHVSTIRFADDSFISLPMEILEEFAAKWRAQVNLPFWVFGANPLHVKEEKLSLLVHAGLVCVRVGLQSGSDRILKFYRRPNRPNLLRDVTNTVARFNHIMLPPNYDIILDNPVETADDIAATLRLINGIPHPITMNICSLRFVPNTDLGDHLLELGITVPSVGDRRFTTVNPTWPNVLMFACATIRLPDPIFEKMLSWVLARREERPSLAWFMSALKLVGFAQRAYRHLRHLDFSVVFGRLGWLLWRIGILQFFWKRSMARRSCIPVTRNDLTRST